MAGRLTLFAGEGGLVPLAVAAAQKAGYAVQVLAIAPRPDLAGVPVIEIELADLPGIVGAVKRFGTTHIVMAGAITMPDAAREALLRFTGSAAVASAGDASLAALGDAFKRITGASLVGVHEIAPGLLAPDGPIGGPAPSAAQLDAAGFALQTARAIGRLDIGQAAIVAGRRIVAVEDIAGTDALLLRVAAYRAQGMAGDGMSALVLAKAVKPQQPLFADLPAIGPQTVRHAKAAGIAVIAVQAGGALVIDREKLAREAGEQGIAVIGLPVSDG